MIDRAHINFPPKLKSGDRVSVISPSGSLKSTSSTKELARQRFSNELGVELVYARNSPKIDILGSSSLESRLKELHAAFKDKNIKAIICATGGYNSNDLLPHIDWDIVKQNPKPIIGSSDNTVLMNALYAKTGMVTYFGPNFFKFGMKLDIEYTIDCFKKCLMSDAPYFIKPSKQWSKDQWYKDQDKREFHKNEGWRIYNPGSAKGRIVGGNLCSLNLLQGTEFMPDLKGTILFIEDDDLAGGDTFGEFNRNLQSLLQLPSAKYIRGIVVGRFSPKSEMTVEKARFIFKTKEQLKKIPVVADVDFGHCDPTATFPIGGTAEIIMNNGMKEIKILRH